MHVSNKNKKKGNRKKTFCFYIKCTDIKKLKAIQVLKTVIKLFCLFQAHIVGFSFAVRSLD